MKEKIDAAATALAAVREKKPLVMCLTNSVAAEFTANALVALGASPVMLAENGEVLKFAELCDSSLVNVGTVSREQGEAMRAVVARMNAFKKPWVLDPVAYGLLPFRTFLCNEFMRRRPTVIRANAAEVAAMAGEQPACHGVDCGTVVGDPAQAKRVSAACLTTVLLSGATDYVVATDPITRKTEPILSVANGSEMLAGITASGCVQGALAAAFVAVAPSETAALAAALAESVAGEIAAKSANGPGSFKAAFLDALAALTPAAIVKAAKVDAVD